jgi:Ca2+-binding EF-hand superfamily protein
LINLFTLHNKFFVLYKKANRLKRENMTQEDLIKYKEMFDEMDKDGNGILDMDEFRASFFSADNKLSKWEKIRAVSIVLLFFLI